MARGYDSRSKPVHCLLRLYKYTHIRASLGRYRGIKVEINLIEC